MSFPIAPWYSVRAAVVAEFAAQDFPIAVRGSLARNSPAAASCSGYVLAAYRRNVAGRAIEETSGAARLIRRLAGVNSGVW